MSFRIYIEKKPAFNVASRKLTEELQLVLPGIICEVIIIYDIFNSSQIELEKVMYTVFADPITDLIISHEKIIHEKNYISTEFIPGQYDQRADSAEQAIFVITGNSKIKVRSSKVFIFNKIKKNELKLLKKHLINSVDTREKDLSIFEYPSTNFPKIVSTFEKFNSSNNTLLKEFYTEQKFSFGFDDLLFIQDYFKKEKRNPTETELKVLDTYWSDHCRHTTFLTELKNIQFEGPFKIRLKSIFNHYLETRKKLKRAKNSITLMDLATISAKYLHKIGKLNDIVISDEINACTVNVEIEVEEEKETWELLFKNETHNHPTEIEPFGGASTCVGGAIRDPLSGRAFVYQAMRITGSGNPLEKIEDTWEGKLPQRKITKEAAHGFSSYGNQIGLATSQIAEIYDDGYKAKRMEVGMVIGAVPKKWVRREKPVKGDKIIVIGGKTGRDGIGGATGSSKTHTIDSIATLNAEVQKGNAVEERKIQRFFRNPNVCKLIKKSNDFGAGGVAVAIGEIAEGVSINLDKLPTKYQGLNGTELAISESQERMAVVIDSYNTEKFIELAQQENLSATAVAEVTDNNRLEMYWRGEKIVDINRVFLDTSGVQKENEVTISSPLQDYNYQKKELTKDNFKAALSALNTCSQKGLIQMFDSSVGQTTVLMPLGGKNQLTPAACSVHTFPVLKGKTNDVSIASWGFSPTLSSWSPLHGGAFAVVESLAKIVACGGDYKKSYLSFQEYFERLGNDKIKWGKPLGSLLGAYEAQLHFEIAAIGGKDSMSGTFNEYHVPPTLISFAVATGKIEHIISQELKEIGSYLYVVEHIPDELGMPNYKQLKKNFNTLYTLILEKKIITAQPIKNGGIACELFKMAIGNEIGVSIEYKKELFSPQMGSIIIETKEKLTKENFILLGTTQLDKKIIINSKEFEINELKQAWEETLEPIFNSKTYKKTQKEISNNALKNSFVTHTIKKSITKLLNTKPKVCLPIFPGTNCEYETQKVLEEEGAGVHSFLIKNISPQLLKESINYFAKEINESQIIVLPGGFSAGDEPDGSAKYMVSVLKTSIISDKIHAFLERGGLLLGICNGFQALIKSGLLPYGEIKNIDENSPTLTFNEIGRHISQIAKIKVSNDTSPWLMGMKGKEYLVPFSHSEGRFYATQNWIDELILHKQIATQYIDFDGSIATEMPYNPNGSVFGIEGITDKTGQIYGRMGHLERYRKGLMKNIPDIEYMNIFRNGVDYFK